MKETFSFGRQLTPQTVSAALIFLTPAAQLDPHSCHSNSKLIMKSLSVLFFSLFMSVCCHVFRSLEKSYYMKKRDWICQGHWTTNSDTLAMNCDVTRAYLKIKPCTYILNIFDDIRLLFLHRLNALIVKSQSNACHVNRCNLFYSTKLALKNSWPI